MIFDIYNSFVSHIGCDAHSDVHNYFNLEVFSSINSSICVNVPLCDDEMKEIQIRLNLILNEV